MKLTEGPILQGRFIERPNRFLVRAELPESGMIDASLPNPGRLHELLLPGAKLFLTRAEPRNPDGPARRTSFTVQAVEREGAVVGLNTHRTNRIARYLLDRGLVPGLEDASVVREEVTVGDSRFDLRLNRGGRDLMVEVKSVTLFGNGIAMFPDAVTSRGRRHLLELAEWTGPGRGAMVLFIVQTPRVNWFMPDYHTDLALSEAFLEVQDRVEMTPVAIAWDDHLHLRHEVRRLPVPWAFLEREVADRGAYLLILRLNARTRVEVGELGAQDFAPGFYVYVGSAMRALSQRLSRHARRRKRFHWHIDYLRDKADAVQALPIRSSRRQETEIACELEKIMAPGPIGFGASDSSAGTHLFCSKEHPLDRRDFHELLHRFRMPPPA